MQKLKLSSLKLCGKYAFFPPHSVSLTVEYIKVEHEILAYLFLVPVIPPLPRLLSHHLDRSFRFFQNYLPISS